MLPCHPARWQLPLGRVVHPLNAAGRPVPVSHTGSGIVRCKRCRTYINPFVTWTDGGRCGRSSPSTPQAPQLTAPAGISAEGLGLAWVRPLPDLDCIGRLAMALACW